MCGPTALIKNMSMAALFGEKVTDPTPDMCMNGVVFPDLSLKPGAYEVRNGQSPVRVIQLRDPYLGTSRWYIVNDYHTLDLSHVKILWEIVCDGEVTEGGQLRDYHTPAGAREILDMPADLNRYTYRSYVNYYVVYKNDTDFAKAGDEIYRCQIPVGRELFCPEKGEKMWDKDGEKLRLEETEDSFVITGDGLEVIYGNSRELLSGLQKMENYIFVADRKFFTGR